MCILWILMVHVCVMSDEGCSLCTKDCYGVCEV